MADPVVARVMAVAGVIGSLLAALGVHGRISVDAIYVAGAILFAGGVIRAGLDRLAQPEPKR